MIVLDTGLLVKKSLLILVQNGVFSYPACAFILAFYSILSHIFYLYILSIFFFYTCFSSFIDRVAGIVSAPLWNSKTSAFAGLLTSTDFINVIQYYWQFPDKLSQIDGFRLDSLRGQSLAPS